MKLIKKTSGLTLLIGSLICSTSLYAAEDIAYDTIRRMGMGGAATTITYDDSALMINPAGLARVKGVTFKAPRLGVDVGTEFWDASDKINDLSSANDDNLGVINSLVGTNGSVRAHLSPLLALTNKGFGIGAFGGADFRLRINQDSSLDMVGYGDGVLGIGIAKQFTLYGTTFDAGISLKGIARTTIYDKVTGKTNVHLSDSELVDRINNDTMSDAFSQYNSTGFGVDIGVLSDLILLDTPTTIGGAIRNIGATLTGEQEVGTGNFTSSRSVSTELPIMTIIGMSMTPTAPMIGNVLVAADYQVYPAKNFYNALSMGIEKKLFFDTFHVRGGIHQGYIVGGLGFDFRIFHADFAYYERELGDTPGDTPDAMYTFQIGVLF